MADPLDIPLSKASGISGTDENNGLVQFITKRLLSDSADHMFGMMEGSPTLKMLYDGSHHLLKATMGGMNKKNKEDMVAKLIQLYLLTRTHIYDPSYIPPKQYKLHVPTDRPTPKKKMYE